MADILKTLERKLRKEKSALEKRLDQIRDVLAAMNGATPRKKFSAATRRKMAAAQKRRWATKKNG